jgi:Outer membrane protein beta-barrel domain
MDHIKISVRKKICIIILVVLHATSLFSQERKFEWGAAGYYALSTIVESEFKVLEGPAGNWRNGLATGVYFSQKLHPRWALGLDVMYVGKGAHNSLGETNGENLSFISKLRYAEASLYVKYNITRRFSANMGMYGGYFLQDMSRGGIYSNDEREPLVQRDLDVIRSLDTGFLFGFRYNIWQRFIIVAQYHTGAANLFDATQSTFTEYNHTLRLGVECRIR